MSISRFHSSPNNIALLLTVVSCTPFLIACSSSSIDGERVHGTVTVDGELAEQGAISFKSLGKKTSISGSVIRQGKYEAIVPIGKSKVEIVSL